MPRVYFWNAEHLSTNAELLAQNKEAAKERARLSEMQQARNHASKGAVVTPAITRSMYRAAASVLGKRRRDEPHARTIYSDDRNVQRQVESELSHLLNVERLQYRADVSRRKVQTQNWLETRPAPVFYCEVQQAFPGNTSSLRNAVVPGAATLCYWTNVPGGIVEPLAFPAVGAGIPGPPGGPHLVQGKHRIPKIVVYGGVNLFFWHAPSSNNGQVVAAMWNFIQATYAGNNILFGDLNTNPGQLLAQGVPLGQIIAPVAPTRISGRTLDYALSSFQPVLIYRAFDHAAPHAEIKRRFGSDHAAMCLRW
ncbi:hypothetical protein [Xanthomonas vesicatoria]|uniref:hypothetical protein n=1 Tax=Xanthomonas vesicatoria TaxID=56460 RepID=UPI001E2B2AED|nr:hypothetical protein [Xanthomonas vesicatoria]MCC8618664.1 hypothetical protein [Xanthomonas vesicatoria]MCC8632100.1 hypothetical protein [Xanthomonas vesicatoria]